MAKLRLDKYLAEMGCGTRSQIKEAARMGRVQVNGRIVRASDQKIDSGQDQIEMDGKPVAYIEFEYYMLNKPAGVISATEDPFHRTVLDLIQQKARQDLFPVGRLDIDTEGLLLITNDGPLCHRLLSPKNHVEKVYYIEVDDSIPADTVQTFAEGMDIGEGVITLPARLELLSDKTAMLAIQEGKFHQIKRMFQAIGRNVIYLKRISMGPLVLDKTLSCGAYRSLTEKELEQLRGTSFIMEKGDLQ